MHDNIVNFKFKSNFQVTAHKFIIIFIIFVLDLRIVHVRREIKSSDQPRIWSSHKHVL